MSEEEKKAIEIVKEITYIRGIRQDVEGHEEDYWALDIVLNLIDKQQKEIEELRKENFDTVYIQAIENYKTKIREKIKEIEKNEKGFEYSDKDVTKILEELLEE